MLSDETDVPDVLSPHHPIAQPICRWRRYPQRPVESAQTSPYYPACPTCLALSEWLLSTQEAFTDEIYQRVDYQLMHLQNCPTGLRKRPCIQASLRPWDSYHIGHRRGSPNEQFSLCQILPDERICVNEGQRARRSVVEPSSTDAMQQPRQSHPRSPDRGCHATTTLTRPFAR